MVVLLLLGTGCDAFGHSGPYSQSIEKESEGKQQKVVPNGNPMNA
jgi:hypothetical protein